MSSNRYGDYSKYFADDWKYLDVGDYKREQARFEKRYKEELKDFEKYQKHMNKYAERGKGWKLAKDIGVGMLTGGGNVSKFGKAAGFMDDAGLLDFGIDALMTAKANTDQFNVMTFGNMRPTDFARFRNPARAIQEEFDEKKKTMFRHGEERLASAPKIMDYINAKAITDGINEWRETKKTPTEGDSGNKYQAATDRALGSSWTLGRDISSTIDEGRKMDWDLRDRLNKSYR